MVHEIGVRLLSFYRFSYRRICRFFFDFRRVYTVHFIVLWKLKSVPLLFFEVVRFFGTYVLFCSKNRMCKPFLSDCTSVPLFLRKMVQNKVHIAFSVFLFMFHSYLSFLCYTFATFLFVQVLTYDFAFSVRFFDLLFFRRIIQSKLVYFFDRWYKKWYKRWYTKKVDYYWKNSQRSFLVYHFYFCKWYVVFSIITEVFLNCTFVPLFFHSPPCTCTRTRGL